jgi:hydrogenase maturation protein HypF
LPRRVQARLRGIVQGVGFRPFVYNLARRLGLGGSVRNTSAGLIAEVEGDPAGVDRFLEALTHEAPPLAWIQDIAVTEISPTGGAEFVIEPSVSETGEFALVSPDVATCPECLIDFTSPANRRLGYAFTNCTNCGPRYTIVRDIPYDRPNTTMAPFRMCAACQAEYDDPANRRFHAQPNACAECGPALSAPVEEARSRLAAGEIAAIKGLGGFHLACDARDAAAVERLRARKRRSEKPFALMARDLAAAEEICQLSDADRAVLSGARRPIVILPTREPSRWRHVAPGNRTLGVMLPYTPLHHLLFQDAPYSALVMTSGNLSEEPIVVDNREARQHLAGVPDWFLTHNRAIYMRADDSVVRTFEGRERVLRRSRGYVPQPLDLGRGVPELLAVGGELKNAFCLTKGRHAILSQHIGDLENYETLLFFEETLANLKKLFRVTPRAVAYDLHPGYLSTRYALSLAGLTQFGVQHHHAHIASCMAENHLEGEVIGVAFDGTGYGPDGAIWGGEFLVAGYAAFERRGHLRYVPLAGGDAAIREPWRAALAYCQDTVGTRFDTPPGLRAVPEDRIRVVRRMIEKGVNTVPTSSCGRLFDAVAAIIGLRHEVTFEGQAAIELEMIAGDSDAAPYSFELTEAQTWEVDFRPMIERMVASGEPPPVIAARFHNTVAEAIAETCRRIRGQSGLRRVCLSGGTFQNVRLLTRTLALLRAADFEVFLHADVPPNDGGIALGQAAIAAARMR